MLNSQKLTKSEEYSLKKWILDMDKQGLPPSYIIVHRMADLLLSDHKNNTILIGPNWVT